ncbi:MAG TPA: VTT domain-containing protein [Herbaspirillum sp.]|jgi:membrane-associated protein
MDLVQFLELILHVDKFLDVLIAQYGAMIYAVLFLIVFCETGLVVFPFLPGDTLLFIAGAFCAGGAMNIWELMSLLVIAAATGNTVNYWIGNKIGDKVLGAHYAWLERWIDRSALTKTHAFYEHHGGKTIVLSRFIPIVRTFAPFVAGMSKMTFHRFQVFNIVGALAWVVVLVVGGYFFGNIRFVRHHLNVIVLVGVAGALLPIILAGLWQFWKMTRKKIKRDVDGI